MSFFVQNTPSLLLRVPHNFALIGVPKHLVKMSVRGSHALLGDFLLHP
jgi:hypothetical protein